MGIMQIMSGLSAHADGATKKPLCFGEAVACSTDADFLVQLSRRNHGKVINSACFNMQAVGWPLPRRPQRHWRWRVCTRGHHRWNDHMRGCGCAFWMLPFEVTGS